MTKEEFINRVDEIMCGTSNAERAYLEDLYNDVTAPHWNPAAGDIKEETSAFLVGYACGMKDGKLSKWISVKDRFPKARVLVLIHRQNGEIINASRDDDFTWWDSDGHPINNNITHWMLLPPPEKGE